MESHSAVAVTLAPRSHVVGVAAGRIGYGSFVRLGRNVEVRPLGGSVGCLTMIIVSIVASVLLTIIVNLLAR